MRILDEGEDRSLNRITLYLTMSEASEMRDTLEALLADPVERHEHISSSDYLKELTVCIYDPNSLGKFDERSKKLILEDT